MHPRAVSSGFVDGILQWDSAEEFAEFCAKAVPDLDGEVPAWAIETLVVSGRTAIAVIRDQWGNRRFRDSLTLLRIDDRWLIVFKAFHGLG